MRKEANAADGALEHNDKSGACILNSLQLVNTALRHII